MIIQNRDELLGSDKYSKGREILLDLAESAIKSVNAYQKTLDLIKLEDNMLFAEDHEFDLSNIDKIFVIGAGKASFPIAKALETIMNDKIKSGIVIVKEKIKENLKNIKVIESSHPIPDKRSIEGAKQVIEIIKHTEEDDLVICAITGGASALMELPVVDLKDLIKVNRLLLKSGAALEEINTVRKHISKIKGGKLARYIHPAKILNLIVIDEIAGNPWGPTVPDNTTFENAIGILKKRELWNEIPEEVGIYLEDGLADSSLETPKPTEFHEIDAHTVILGNNEIMCNTAKSKAEDLGLNTLLLSTVLEGESREAGMVLGSIAKEIELNKQPVNPPCCLIMGGETTVTIKDVNNEGEGGPSQEFVLGSSFKVDGSEKIAIMSMDTDGTDGPTNIAGGIVDGFTLSRAKRKNIDIFKNLINHNSSYVLNRLQDTIYTGPTGTNIMNLYLAVILD